MVDALTWKKDHLQLIDQRYLPFKSTYFPCRTVADTAFAIREMVVRGAPAIGVTAAYGLVLAIKEDASRQGFKKACDLLAAARPTAVNLFDAISYMKRHIGDPEGWSDVLARATELAQAYHTSDQEMNRAIGHHGSSLIDGKCSLLTHCNTGSLATSGWGTALGVIRQIHEEGRLNMLYANETRPFLQGARLTAWECHQDNIPVSLITDGMGGYLMSQKMVNAVIVGADRIAANGDVANKIGTSMLAMAARYHGLPFFVAAPRTTIDPATLKGADIPIEQRPTREITHIRDQLITSEETRVINPAFDVTPAELVSAIITEKGAYRFPYDFRGIRNQ